MRRGLARVARVLLALVGGLVLLAAVALAFFMTPPGEALLNRFLVARINEQIEGRVTIDELSFSGDALELGVVRVYDPQGQEVLGVGRLGVDVELASLVRGRLVLNRLSARDARVALERTPDGAWNLARALSPRQPSAEEGGGLPDLAIEQLELQTSELTLALPPGGRSGLDTKRVSARDLGASGWLRIRDQHFDADVRGQAQLVEPDRAPMHASVRARYEPDENIQAIELQGSLGDASARIDVRVPDDLALPEVDAAALERLTAAVFVDAPAFELAESEYGPLRLDAQLRGGRLSVPVLRLDLPGLRLTRREPPEDTALAARLEIESLAPLAEALGTLLGRELPPLSGHGELRLALAGPLDAAQLRVRGTLRGLETGPVRARSFSTITAATLPFARNAPAPAHVRLEADALELNDYAVGHATLDARWSEGGRLTLSAEAGAAPGLRVHAEGERAAGERALRIDELRLSYPSTSWTLASPPGWLRWGDGAGVELALRSGEQRIELGLQNDLNHTRLRAALSSVRLESVLGPLAESVLGRRPVRGTLDARLVAERSGAAAPWTGDARVELSRGRWGGVRGLSFALDAHADAGRAQGSFRADVLSGRARGSFDLPAEWPPPDGAPLSADARLVGLRLGALWREFGARAPSDVSERVQSVSGALAAGARVKGQWPSPELTARVELDDGALQLASGERYRDIELTADATRDWVSIHPLVIESGAGRLAVSGYIARRGSGARFELDAQVEGGFPIPAAPFSVSSANFTASGELSSRRLKLTMTSSGVRIVEPQAAVVSQLAPPR